MSILIN